MLQGGERWPVQTERSSAESFLAATTPRDVHNTLIQGYIQHQVAQHPFVAPVERDKVRDELSSDEDLEREVDELVRRDTTQREVPIQAGFGIGTPPPGTN